jgi:SAM-dependent methyltransferase
VRTRCPPIGHNAKVEYEAFADIYGVWTATAPSAHANHAFYVDAYVNADGPVVELGVGDGRIAVAAAVLGQAMVGVDSAPAMLALCRARADREAVSERVTLIEADFRRFELPVPAGLIALPYHSIGHLQSLEAKRAAVRHIHSQLRPGGTFVFDDFFMTPARIERMRQVQLRAEYTAADGTDLLLWVTSLVNEADQSISVVTWEDALDARGVLQHRRYRRLSLSWLQPCQAQQLLEEAGFTVDACYGDFDRTPFDAASAQEHIWMARKSTRS